MNYKSTISIAFFYFFSNACYGASGITNTHIDQLGGDMSSYVYAKIASLKYNLPMIVSPFTHADLFKLDVLERKLSDLLSFKQIFNVTTEQVLHDNVDSPESLFIIGRIISFHETVYLSDMPKLWIEELRRCLQPKNKPEVNDVPKNKISVAVHIRKGNGGGELYDGVCSSEQVYDFDRSLVEYTNLDFFPFLHPEFAKKIAYEKKNQSNPSSKIFLDRNKYWETKFPPDQYYIDQLKRLSEDLDDLPIFVQIFTDDRNPQELLNRIKKHVNKKNISYHFQNNRELSHRERIIHDLYNISRFDCFICSQSYFAKTALLMGDHKIIIYPLDSRWIDNKLIMTLINVQGSLIPLKRCAI